MNAVDRAPAEIRLPMRDLIRNLHATFNVRAFPSVPRVCATVHDLKTSDQWGGDPVMGEYVIRLTIEEINGQSNRNAMPKSVISDDGRNIPVVYTGISGTPVLC